MSPWKEDGRYNISTNTGQHHKETRTFPWLGSGIWTSGVTFRTA